jgi:hypothetical protein
MLAESIAVIYLTYNTNIGGKIKNKIAYSDHHTFNKIGIAIDRSLLALKSMFAVIYMLMNNIIRNYQFAKRNIRQQGGKACQV